MSIHTKHVSEDILELYAMNRLGEDDIASVEEHLLVCPECNDVLDRIQDFVSATKGAASRLEMVPPDVRAATPARPWYVNSKAVWGAVAFAVLAFVFYNPRVGGTAHPVYLEAVRGEVSPVSSVPASTSLELKLSTAGLETVEIGKVSIVRMDGSPAFGGTGKTEGKDQLVVMLPDGLDSGTYWVRAYGRDGKLVREYGLRVQ